MTESEWLACTDPTAMLMFLRGKASDRKLRMISFGCCQTIWSLIPEEPHRVAIRLAERHADRQATDAELGAVVRSVHRARRKRNEIDSTVYYAVRCPRGTGYNWADAAAVASGVSRIVAREAAPNPSPTAISYFRGDQLITEEPPPNSDRILWNETRAEVLRKFAVHIRDIIGNPFRPVVVDPSWRTSTVIALANGVYQEKAFDRLPILADALEDAGCDSADVLEHLRGDGPHVRGCWVVDLLLGKE